VTAGRAKNEEARYHMKIAVNVAMVLTTCCVIAGSPKYVSLAGKSSARAMTARAMTAREVNAGGPTLMNMPGSHVGVKVVQTVKSPHILYIHEKCNEHA
jgi:hypothetical protein